MKKLSFITLIAICAIQLFAQSSVRLNRINFYPAQNNAVLPNYNIYRLYEYPNSNTNLPSSITQHNYNNTLSAFAPVLRNVFAYNLSGLVIENLTEVWENNQWKPFRKFTYSYDGNNRLTTENHYGWTNNNWFEYHRKSYGYDNFGYVNQKARMDTVNGILRNTDRERWARTNTGLLQAYYKEVYSSGNWVTMEIEEYMMSLNPMRWDSTIVSIKPNVTSPSFTHVRTYYYTYDSLWQVVERKDKNISSNFVNQRFVYEYEPNWGLITRDERQYWNIDSAKFIPADGNYYVYDNQKRVVDFRIKQSDFDTRVELTTYAPDSSVISTTIQQYDWNNATLSVSGKTEYLFDLLNTTSVGEINSMHTKAFPNPFNTHALLEFESTKSGIAQIMAFDINGRMASLQSITVEQGSNSIIWQATDMKGNALPSGFYTLQVSNGSSTHSFKLIKQ